MFFVVVFGISGRGDHLFQDLKTDDFLGLEFENRRKFPDLKIDEPIKFLD